MRVDDKGLLIPPQPDIALVRQKKKLKQAQTKFANELLNYVISHIESYKPGKPLIIPAPSVYTDLAAVGPWKSVGAKNVVAESLSKSGWRVVSWEPTELILEPYPKEKSWWERILDWWG